MNIVSILIITFGMVEGVVLDPALYLSPSPPLTTTHSNDAEKLWSHTVESENNKKVSSGNYNGDSLDSTPSKITEEPFTKLSETMEQAETFWPSYRSTSLRGFHIPLTFHLSGAYGGKSGTGVLSSGYMDIASASGGLGTALAGTGYKSYRRPSVRIYSADVQPAWGGWGNGKWGHYGKG